LRMQRMRRLVRERNVYQWAGTLIEELCEIRLDSGDEKDSARALARLTAGERLRG